MCQKLATLTELIVDVTSIITVIRVLFVEQEAFHSACLAGLATGYGSLNFLLHSSDFANEWQLIHLSKSLANSFVGNTQIQVFKGIKGILQGQMHTAKVNWVL